jgi:hypothetical protein
MITKYYWDSSLKKEIKLDEYHSVEPRPEPETLSALYELRGSEWFGQECESANFHSLDSWLEECAQAAEEELQLIKEGKIK